jgi:hypothetical protein
MAEAGRFRSRAMVRCATCGLWPNISVAAPFVAALYADLVGRKVDYCARREATD